MKKLSVLFTSIILLSITVLNIFAANPNSEELKLIRELGKYNKPLTSEEKSEIALKGDTISISEKELNQATNAYRVAGSQNPYEEAKKSLLKKEALYQKALKQGYNITDKEVYLAIEKQKEVFHKVDINPEEVNAYFEGMGMTIDEYWDTQFDNLKKK